MTTVYIGTEKNQRIPTIVARHSLLRRASIPVSVEFLADIAIPFRTVTGFSFYRFLIPERMKYRGTAIYADCDILWLSDVRDLLNACADSPVNAVPNGKEHWHTSLMVMECSRLTHWLGSAWLPRCVADMEFYKSLLRASITGEVFKDFSSLSPNWNSMDAFDADTKLPRDLLIGAPPCNELDDRTLARCQLVAGARRCDDRRGSCHPERLPRSAASC